jgi:hypothetical protein
MVERACIRCRFVVQVTAPPPHGSRNPSWETHFPDVNTRTNCLSPPVASCRYLHETIETAYYAGQLIEKVDHD